MAIMTWGAGIDCVYTVEASLAGLQPYHFGAPDLMLLGERLCCA